MKAENMTPEVFNDGLELLTSRRPFRPFIIELVGGDRFEVDHANAVAWGEGRGIGFFGPGGVPHIFDSESVLQFIDAPAHAIRPRKPKK
jgi:hypothetical protein